MIEAEYQRVALALGSTAHEIEKAKRPAYTQASADVLFNFKHVAEQAGITPLQAWSVYFMKHIMAITAFAKDPSILQAESIVGRFADAKNYLSLGLALAVDADLVTLTPINEK